MRKRVLILAVALLLSSACSASTEPLGESDDSLTSAEADTQRSAMSPNVEILVEPSDVGSALLKAIASATKSVHVTMYLLTDEAILNELVARHRAGVDVKVILNSRFDNVGMSNQPTFDRLHAAHIPVVFAPTTFVFTHEKCIVIDGKAAWIMTMNATPTSLMRNREFLAIDTTTADVAEAEAQFSADFGGHPYTPSGALLMSPVTTRPGILGLIAGAKRTLDFEVEEMSDGGLVAALCSAAQRQVTVRGAIADQDPSRGQQKAIDELKRCGVKLVAVKHPYLHAKAIVADGARVYVGSANFSQTSLDRNRELGLVTANTAAVATVASTIAVDIGGGLAL